MEKGEAKKVLQKHLLFIATGIVLAAMVWGTKSSLKYIGITGIVLIFYGFVVLVSYSQLKDTWVIQ